MTTKPITPRAISRLDRGAEYMGRLPDGSTAWGVVVKPPSGIERDLVYVTMPGGTARPATERDFERIQR